MESDYDKASLDILVELDKAAKPPVVITKRLETGVASGTEIRWKRQGTNFDIIKFDGDDENFKDQVVQPSYINCTFETKKNPGTDHIYTITVCDNEGVEHTSDDSEAVNPTDGKAVIRN